MRSGSDGIRLERVGDSRACPIGDDLGVLADADGRRPQQAEIGTAAGIANVAVLVAVGFDGPGRMSDQPAGKRFPDV